MKSFKKYVTEGAWGRLGGEELFVKQNNGRRVSKLMIPPVDNASSTITIWRVYDKDGNIVQDTKTIIPRPYFTNEQEAIEAMNSNAIGVSREKL